MSFTVDVDENSFPKSMNNQEMVEAEMTALGMHFLGYTYDTDFKEVIEIK